MIPVIGKYLLKILPLKYDFFVSKQYKNTPNMNKVDKYIIKLILFDISISLLYFARYFLGITVTKVFVTLSSSI